MRNKKTIWISFIIIIAIAMIGGGIYIIFTSTDETKDWETYTSTQYGFEFKYSPTVFEIFRVEDDVYDNPVFVELRPLKKDDFKNAVTIIVEAEKDANCPVINVKDSQILGNVTIDGINTEKIKVRRDEGDYFSDYVYSCIKKGELTYTFSCHFIYYGEYDYTQFDSILSTFKFAK